MRLFIFYIFICAVLTFSPLSNTAQAEKCACTPTSISARFNNADVIFTGSVTAIETIEKYVEYGNRDLPVSVILTIDELFKGEKTDKDFVLKTSLTHDTCTGHPFEKGKKYLIFAYQRQAATFEYWSLYLFPSGTYDVGGLCGGTKSMEDPETQTDIESIRHILELREENKNNSTWFFNR